MLCLVELLEQFNIASHDAPDFSFWASDEEELSTAASEGRPMPSDAEVSAELPPLDAMAQSECKTELVAMIAWATKSFRLEWNPPPCPEHSRWMIGIWAPVVEGAFN